MTDLAAHLTATHPRPLLLAEVLARLGIADAPPPSLSPETRFLGLAYDSRQVSPGDLFVALRGEQVDGHGYLTAAWERGARAAVVEDSSREAGGLPLIATADTRRALSQLSDLAFDAPSMAVACIGITGTKGKTSTSYFLRHLLEAGGHPTGVIGTLGITVQEETLPLALTTPESYDLQRMLAMLRDQGCSHAVMEVSAHGIHFQRTRDIRFQRAIFTNLGQDHLDFFGTMERYAAAKARWFTEQLPEVPDALALLNLNDELGQTLAATLDPARVLTYGTNVAAHVRGQLKSARAEGLLLAMAFPTGDHLEVLVPLGGAFFAANLLAAAATAHSLGIDTTTIAQGLATMPPVPGRHEVVSTIADDLTVIVDYAHTPQSVAAILATVERRPHHPVIALVGCGGDRDRTKRPQMGRLAYEATDQLVITSDNPRTEDPEQILREIVAGVPAASLGHRVTVEVDRGIAIADTIATAPAGSVIFILGKGHEPYQILRGRTIPFDDRAEARRALASRRAARVGVAP